MEDEKLLSVINKSGFPLQIKIAHLIGKPGSSHGCKVIYQEHAWKNPIDNTSGFIDLIVEKAPGRQVYKPPGHTVFNIECKRVIDSTWLFISSKPQPEKRRQVKVYKLWKENNETKDFGFVDINADPRCYEADFCVVHGQDSKERPMLERIAANLVSSSEGLAIEEKQYFSHLPRVIRFYINVIVTTAKLKVCQYNPGNISVDLGTLSAADFEELPYVRFRKQLTTQHELSGELKSGGYVGVERAKQNTVFVVNAEHLIDFLSEFAIDSRAFDGD